MTFCWLFLPHSWSNWSEFDAYSQKRNCKVCGYVQVKRYK